MKKTAYLLTEFFLIYVLLPVSFALDYPVLIKAILVLLGFGYILFVLKRVERISFRLQRDINWRGFWRPTLWKFLLIAVLTTAYVLYKDPGALFYVPRTNLGLFVFILFVYSVLSVWPQEVIYRTFYFERYERLFKNRSLFLFVNAIVFSLAHIFFRNTLVLILTFIGGILFALTYLRSRSTTLVSIEHALYGNWLFTVGMGQMLAFPGMEAPQ
ncbi:MAG: CPBP family intramembrane glutamic endopeptidase [Bacteroidota bacterium]